MNDEADKPAISVVIAAHDERRWDSLLTTVSSAMEQSLKPSAVIVAVDHNPELAERLARELPILVIARNEGQHRGASATRNAGVAASATEFVAFLDDDEIAETDWLEGLIEPFKDLSVVGTGGRYVPAWESRRPSWFPDELAWAVGAHHTGMPDRASPVRNVWSGNMAVRTSVFASVGGFREGFGKTGNRSRPEDTDLCIRMARAVPSGQWIYLPDARIHHSVPAERATFGFFVRRCYAEGRGKIDMQAEHTGTDALATEREYLRVTIPNGFRSHLRDAAAAGSRAAAIGMGVGAAGLGAAVSRWSIAIQRRRRE